jgi:hypothetical protein
MNLLITAIPITIVEKKGRQKVRILSNIVGEDVSAE